MSISSSLKGLSLDIFSVHDLTSWGMGSGGKIIFSLWLIAFQIEILNSFLDLSKKASDPNRISNSIDIILHMFYNYNGFYEYNRFYICSVNVNNNSAYKLPKVVCKVFSTGFN